MSRFTVITGFILGIAFRSFFDPGASFYLLPILIALFLFACHVFYRNQLNKELELRSLIIILICFSLGMAWYAFRADPKTNLLQNRVGQSVLIKVTVSSEPEEKNGKIQSIVNFTENNITQKILIKTPLFPKYKYGDTLQIFGEIKQPENFSDDFDYISYLAKDDIYYLMDTSRVKVISSENNFDIIGYLLQIKSFFTQNINEVLPEPHSSLLAGLVLGSRDSLGKEWIDRFRIAGLSHIVVLSGYNLTIIADSAMKVISRFATGGLASLFGAVSIILFTMMTGGGASTVRAAIMALIIMLAKVTGRMYEASSALIVAGFLMILQNPRVLVFDISFQLSFLATLGLLYLSPLLKKYLTFVTERGGLREVVATTLGAQISTAPLIIYKMGTFSLVALPVNILVLALIPATMFFGFMAATLNIFSFYIAIPFIAISWMLLSYELFVVDVFSALPLASINISLFDFVLFLIFSTLILVIYRFKNSFASPVAGWVIEDIS